MDGRSWVVGWALEARGVVKGEQRVLEPTERKLSPTPTPTTLWLESPTLDSESQTLKLDGVGGNWSSRSIAVVSMAPTAGPSGTS